MDAKLIVEFHFEGDLESSGPNADEGRHMARATFPGNVHMYLPSNVHM